MPDETAPQPWIIEGERTILDARLLRLRGVRARSRAHPDRHGEFIVVDTADWVNVIALTPDERVVMVEQYRHGTREVTLEIPGGIVDPGEGFVEAGVRELAEETGYAGEPAEQIGVVAPNPAIQSNRCATVLVRGARPVAPPAPDHLEEIRVRTVPLADVPRLIREGRIVHGLVVAAFQHLAAMG